MKDNDQYKKETSTYKLAFLSLLGLYIGVLVAIGLMLFGYF